MSNPPLYPNDPENDGGDTDSFGIAPRRAERIAREFGIPPGVAARIADKYGGYGIPPGVAERIANKYGFHGIIDFGAAGSGWESQWQGIFDFNIAQGRPPEVAAAQADILFGKGITDVWRQAVIDKAKADAAAREQAVQLATQSATASAQAAAVLAQQQQAHVVPTGTGGGAATATVIDPHTGQPVTVVAKKPGDNTMLYVGGAVAVGLLAMVAMKKKGGMGSYGYARRHRKSRRRARK